MFTLAEVAEYLRVTERFLRNEIDRGRLKAMKVGTGRQATYRISQESRDAYIKSSAARPRVRAS